MLSDPVNDRGVHFSYSDTGPPTATSEPYSTLVLIHGTSYHSAIFRPLIPHAPANNLRLVLLNRRDYPGTTPTSPAEVARIRSDDTHVQAEALKDLGVELAQFLVWYVRRARVSDVQSGGGIAVLGWSSGNACGCAMLAHLNALGDQEQNVIKKYLKTYIIYDAPCYVFGLPPPPEVYDAWQDPALPTLQAKTQAFNAWVTAYFHHPDASSGDFAGLAKGPVVNPAPEKTPTIQRLNLAEVTAPDARTRGEGWVQYIDGGVYRENVRKIFRDEKYVGMFPGLRVRLVYCDQTIPEMVWAAHRLKKELDEGNSVRKLEIRVVEGNHFAHWDKPEETLRSWASLL
ncbi:hypothetical protein GLOTRDRAFT_74957 [Gloeophyllum trabeum ATCC 11539]|uniref:AB hydrolase-1 domain-containing protein n=1 Tax=Gloeophyllum trabeum (strain ATCC 11539 / FP-39264 / Madison 617) TaxID=670483 RepID=S7Q8N6_GLOTA|nr:uncharacterized protein GLOTRDRAFT_74957 [Gloeophyllum trabeum ATCC 11539]EPQ56346.1 hypothetical protein GLOTRDRAFT_74957 [Gloeophyllum trabeum ATCC 11539]